MASRSWKTTGRAFLGAAALAACNGGQTQDFCTRSVGISQKFEGQFFMCELDAGLPPSPNTAAEIASCEQTLDAGCSAKDQTALNAAAMCVDDLPPIQCQWFTPSDGGVPISALAWALELFSCEPTGLSPSCNLDSLSFGIPLDGGFGL